jgi:biotin operon repressor
VERKYFNREEITKRLQLIGERLPYPIKVYMIGGGAMGLRREKEVTKDVDIVLINPNELDVFIKTLKNLGYHHNSTISEEYEKLRVAALLRNDEFFQFDIFLKIVCNALELSDEMKRRAEEYGEFKNIHLYLAAPEDIFLFKSITERDKDLEDMIVLLRKGIDEKIIIEECQRQRLKSGRIWEAFVVTKIEELEKRYNVTVPWKRSLLKIGEKETAKHLIINKIKEGMLTVTEMASELGISNNYVRKVLEELKDDGKIVVDKGKRPYRYKLIA